MSSKNLAGYLLAVGPILMMTIWIFVWDAVIGSGAESGTLTGEALITQSLEEGSENISLTTLVATLGMGGMLAMMLGYTLWARLLQGDGKKGGLLATTAAITIPITAAAMMLSMELNFAAGHAWDTGDTVNALIVGAVAEYSMSSGPSFIWTFVSLSIMFIGLATVLQSTDKISKSIGAILAAVALVMLIMNFTTIDGGPLWMVWIVATIAAGVNLIRQKA